MSSGAQRLYISAYTPSSGGRGSGITVFDRESPDASWQATQAVEVDDPSFLAVTEGAVHVVSETVEGRVVSYLVSAGTLVLSSVAASGGAAPCHLVVDPASGALVVANYTGGTIGVLSADASDPARVVRVLALPVGRGPVAARQERPHAHSVMPTPWGTVLVSDLGSDRLHEIRIDPVTLEPAIVDTHPLPAGSGPRHFAWLDSQLLVTGELDGRLHVISRRDSGRLDVDYSVDAYDITRAGAEALLSHVAVADGRVYVAVRGRDTIAVLAAGAGPLAPTSAEPALSIVPPVAGAPLDAGLTRQAGPKTTPGASLDAGATPYTGANTDAGANTTPGASLDAGATPDAGLTPATDSMPSAAPATPGRLALVAEVPTGGVWPRHFALASDSIYIANQFSDSVTVLPLDPTTGIPGAPVLQIEVGTPACVVLV